MNHLKGVIMFKHIPHALAASVLAFGVTYFSNNPTVSYILWPVLVGWSCFFLSGSKPNSGVRALANLAFGGVCAALLSYVAANFADIPREYSLPTAVLVATFVIGMTEKTKYVNLVPFQLIGLATFMGLGYTADIMSVVKVSCFFAVGMVVGYANFHVRNYVSRFMGTTSPWPVVRKRIVSVAAGETGKKAA
jgi:hypothetical protein